MLMPLRKSKHRFCEVFLVSWSRRCLTELWQTINWVWPIIFTSDQQKGTFIVERPIDSSSSWVYFIITYTKITLSLTLYVYPNILRKLLPFFYATEFNVNCPRPTGNQERLVGVSTFSKGKTYSFVGKRYEIVLFQTFLLSKHLGLRCPFCWQSRKATIILVTLCNKCWNHSCFITFILRCTLYHEWKIGPSKLQFVFAS